MSLAGLPTDRFLFAGFLPPRAGERGTVLSELKNIRATLIFFESAQRLAESLAQMADVFGDRAVAVARELTKLHEEVRRGTLAFLAAQYAQEHAAEGRSHDPRRAAAAEQQADTARIDALLDKALAFMPVRAAVGTDRRSARDAPQGNLPPRA